MTDDPNAENRPHDTVADDLFADLPTAAPRRPSASAVPEPASEGERPLTRREARERLAATGAVPIQRQGEPEAEDDARPAPVSAATTLSAEGPSVLPQDAVAPDRPAPRRPTAERAVVESAGTEREAADSIATEPPVGTDALAAVLGERVFVVPSTAARKRRRRRNGWISAIITIVVIAAVAVGGIWAWDTYGAPVRKFFGWTEPVDFAAGEATGEAIVAIAKGDNGSVISKTLFEAGVTKTSSAFYDYLVKQSPNETFYPGTYRLQTRMTSAAVLTALKDPANKVANSLVVREGWTQAQIADGLATALNVAPDAVTAAMKDPSAYGVSAPTLEGWLFPATYTFDPGTTPEQAVQQMVARMTQALDSAGVAAADRQRILTIASIIQREARAGADLAKVSRVIENRLDPSNSETSGLLQMDSTAQYGYGEMHDGSASTSAAAQSDDNPWNTYVHAGLPAGPIANPGDAAIAAALHPADGPWLYFVTVNLDTGETVFSTTYAEHEKAVAQWTQWCKDNPNSGC